MQNRAVSNYRLYLDVRDIACLASLHVCLSTSALSVAADMSSPSNLATWECIEKSCDV